MMPESIERGFVIELRPLGECIVAVLIYPRLFLNDRHAEKRARAIAWAKRMVAIGRSHEIMRVS